MLRTYAKCSVLLQHLAVLLILLRESAASTIQTLKTMGFQIIMATGDALTTAQTDVAISSANVTLMKGDLSQLTQAIRLSQKTLQNMKQNLAFAFLYNGLSIPLAADILYPFTGWALSPIVAAAAMSLSSVSVIGNALRLKMQVRE